MNEASPDWIERFTAAHGRAPRILHVGNIANNAYQTAKMLNAAGADCDVLCADYYHIMGNPEWDDADFIGEVGNQSCPDWRQVDLKGFQRPHWFSQGPRRLAIAYLMARRGGDARRTARLWRRLEKARRHLALREASPLRTLATAWDNARDRVRGVMEARWSPQQTADIVARLRADAEAFFPDRPMAFGPLAEYYIHTSFLYKDLFERYDIVQAYAIDPVWPYLCGCQNYVAWEHGTLRDMPYEDNDRARLTLLSYAAAKVVYVTNVDCYDSAAYITKHSGTPIVCGLHGFDTERVLQKQQAAQNYTFRREDYAKPEQQLFFCPARADIDHHYGTYLKKNDMLYRTLGRLYQEYPGQFKVLQLEWGRDTEALKSFIREECPGLEEAVVWRQPFQKADFYQTLQNCELVFDNFLLPLMGGNGIETLMSGHAALVNKRIPEELMLRFFPEMWPILAVEDEDDIYSAAKAALEDPAACRALAQKGREWILKYHGHAAIVQRNLQSYQLIIPMP